MQGIAASRGVCLGSAFVLPKPVAAEVPKYTISPDELEEQCARLQQALIVTRHQLRELQQQVDQALGTEDASIFDAQLLVLEDPMLLSEVRKQSREQLVNIEHAFAEVTRRYIDSFAAMDDGYLRERSGDIRDVAGRVLQNLAGGNGPDGLASITEPCVLVAHDLTPSQTALLDKSKILGFATDQGSATAHTAILARALRLPAVTGLQDATLRVRSGDHVLLDGFNGQLILRPTDQTLFEYGQLQQQEAALEERLDVSRDRPAVTLDGQAITLSANVESLDEIPAVLASGAEGVGLFRTEFLFLERHGFPSEEEQFAAYREMAVKLAPAPAIIRTLDLGGDKVLSHRVLPEERNPFLGWRAIRICLQERDLFKAQLRAILRASVHGNLKMMYPMISGVDELDQANRILDECRDELTAAGVPFAQDLEVGAMIEIPSAVMTADALAKRVKFFSIGTNDLIQYSLAADRLNPKVAHLHQPTHPGVVRLIKQTIDAAHEAGIWAGVCGESAGDPALAVLLLGLGADELSVSPGLLPRIKYIIRRLKLEAARALADEAMKCENAQEILDRTRALARSLAPELFAAAPGKPSPATEHGSSPKPRTTKTTEA